MESCSEFNPRKRLKKDDNEESNNNERNKRLLYAWFEYAQSETNERLSGKMKYEQINESFQKLLPFLIDCNEDFKHTEGKTILRLFLDKYLIRMNSLSTDQLKKIQNFVKKMIAAGESPLVFDKDGYSIFQLAAMCKNKQLLEVLISCWNDVNACDENGNTALHIVVDNCVDKIANMHKDGYLFIARSLVFKGADIYQRNKKGLTALHLAAAKYHVKMLKLFVNRVVDFNLLTPDDETLLHIACKSLLKLRETSEITDTINLLVSHGCQLESIDKNGKMPLHYAAELGKVKVVESLIELGANIHCQTELSLMTPLHVAARSDRLDVMKILIKNGADVNAEAVDNATPIFQSALHGSLECMQYLIDNGADLYRRDKFHGFTVLHMSAYGIGSTNKTTEDQTQNKLSVLLEMGLEANDAGTCGMTPLLLAMTMYNLNYVKILVEHEADVNYQSDKFELTALHMAMMGSNGEIVKILIEAGANVNCPAGIDNWTPLHFLLALKISWRLGKFTTDCAISTVKFRIKNYFNLQYPCVDIMKILMDNGADVNTKDRFGRSPLHLAAFRYNSPFTTTLLEAGAHPNVQDNQGRTPLLNALHSKNIEALSELLNFGADINDDDFGGMIVNSTNVMKKIAFNYIFRHKIFQLPIAKIYHSWPVSNDVPAVENAQYLQEAQNLKKYQLSDFTLYEFLQMNYNRRCRFVKEVSDSFESLRIFFPYFFQMIYGICSETIHRRTLLQLASVAWVTITKIHMPDICLETIFSYLSNRYLEAFVDSANQTHEEYLIVDDSMCVIGGDIRRKI